MSELTGVIKAKYGSQIKGTRAWIKLIDPEDKRVLVDVGLQAAQHGHLGGKKIAERGCRDSRGRFISPQKYADQQEKKMWDAVDEAKEFQRQYEEELQEQGRWILEALR